MDTSVHDLNCQLIDRRLEEGLALLRRHYTVTKRNIAPELAAFNIGDRPYVSSTRCSSRPQPSAWSKRSRSGTGKHDSARVCG